MTTHQDFTVKSNARRAAKKAGLDPNSVQTLIKAGKKIFRLQLDQPKQTLASAINSSTRKIIAKQEKSKARKAALKKTAGGKTTLLKAATAKPRKFKDPSKPARKTGDKFEQVAAMLRQPGGAAISAITKATAWLPHTARARISVNVSKLLGKGEEIVRTRVDGESHYAIRAEQAVNFLHRTPSASSPT